MAQENNRQAMEVQQQIVPAISQLMHMVDSGSNVPIVQRFEEVKKELVEDEQEQNNGSSLPGSTATLQRSQQAHPADEYNRNYIVTSPLVSPVAEANIAVIHAPNNYVPRSVCGHLDLTKANIVVTDRMGKFIWFADSLHSSVPTFFNTSIVGKPYHSEKLKLGGTASQFERLFARGFRNAEFTMVLKRPTFQYVIDVYGVRVGDNANGNYMFFLNIKKQHSQLQSQSSASVNRLQF